RERQRARVLLVTHIRHLWSGSATGSVRAIRSLADYLWSSHDIDFYCTQWVRHGPDDGAHLYCGQSLLDYGLQRFRYLAGTGGQLSSRDRALLPAPSDPDVQRERRAFARHLAGHRYDVILFEYLHNHHLLDVVDRSRTRCVIDTHDLMHLRAQSYRAVGKSSALSVSREQELACLEQYDKVLAIQEAEYRMLSQCLADRVMLVKRPAELCPLPLPGVDGGRLTLSFLASAAEHNVDAVEWFMTEVWSADLEKRYRLQVFGAVCNALHVHGVQSGDIQLQGPVSSVAEAYRDAHLVINPVRMGSGLKIKNIEALGFGRCVVTTPLGAQGMQGCVDHSVLVAQDSDEFRAVLLRLYEDRELLAKLSSAAVEDAETLFSAASCFDQLSAWLADQASS
ncbi:MAG: glycosyltransferase, partial [Halioglobus sp.]